MRFSFTFVGENRHQTADFFRPRPRWLARRDSAGTKGYPIASKHSEMRLLFAYAIKMTGLAPNRITKRWKKFALPNSRANLNNVASSLTNAPRLPENRSSFATIRLVEENPREPVNRDYRLDVFFFLNSWLKLFFLLFHIDELQEMLKRISEITRWRWTLALS